MKKIIVLLLMAALTLSCSSCSSLSSNNESTEKKVIYMDLPLDNFSTSLKSGKLLSNEAITTFDGSYDDTITMSEDDAKEYRKQTADRLGVDVDETRIFHVPRFTEYPEGSDFYFVVPTRGTISRSTNVLEYPILNQDLYSSDEFNQNLNNKLEVYIYSSMNSEDPYINDLNRNQLKDNLTLLFYNGNSQPYPNISKNVIRDEFKLTYMSETMGEGYIDYVPKLGEHIMWVECRYYFQTSENSETACYTVLYPILVTVE